MGCQTALNEPIDSRGGWESEAPGLQKGEVRVIIERGYGVSCRSSPDKFLGRATRTDNDSSINRSK